MIYELRQYDINPDRWDAFRQWGLADAAPVLFEQFDLPLVGCFEPVPAEDIEVNTSTGRPDFIGSLPGRASRSVTGA